MHRIPDMGFAGTNWLYIAAWLRSWLRQRLYPRKVAWFIDGDRVTPPAGLSFFENCVVWVLHLVIMGAAISATILVFIGAVRLIYG